MALPNAWSTSTQTGPPGLREQDPERRALSPASAGAVSLTSHHGGRLQRREDGHPEERVACGNRGGGAQPPTARRSCGGVGGSVPLEVLPPKPAGSTGSSLPACPAPTLGRPRRWPSRRPSPLCSATAWATWPRRPLHVGAPCTQSLNRARVGPRVWRQSCRSRGQGRAGSARGAAGAVPSPPACPRAVRTATRVGTEMPRWAACQPCPRPEDTGAARRPGPAGRPGDGRAPRAASAVRSETRRQQMACRCPTAPCTGGCPLAPSPGPSVGLAGGHPR